MKLVDKPAGSLENLTVVAFETRRAADIQKMIADRGGRPVVVPALREVSLRECPEARIFGEILLAGGIDVLLLTTWPGTSAVVVIAASARSPAVGRRLRARMVTRPPAMRPVTNHQRRSTTTNSFQTC